MMQMSDKDFTIWGKDTPSKAQTHTHTHSPGPITIHIHTLFCKRETEIDIKMEGRLEEDRCRTEWRERLKER